MNMTNDKDDSTGDINNMSNNKAQSRTDEIRATITYRNARHLLKTKADGNMAEFGRIIQRGNNQVNSYVGLKPDKKIGAKTARLFETSFGMPMGWINQDHGFDQDGNPQQELKRDYKFDGGLNFYELHEASRDIGAVIFDYIDNIRTSEDGLKMVHALNEVEQSAHVIHRLLYEIRDRVDETENMVASKLMMQDIGEYLGDSNRFYMGLSCQPDFVLEFEASMGYMPAVNIRDKSTLTDYLVVPSENLTGLKSVRQRSHRLHNVRRRVMERAMDISKALGGEVDSLYRAAADTYVNEIFRALCTNPSAYLYKKRFYYYSDDQLRAREDSEPIGKQLREYLNEKGMDNVIMALPCRHNIEESTILMRYVPVAAFMNITDAKNGVDALFSAELFRNLLKGDPDGPALAQYDNVESAIEVINKRNTREEPRDASI